MKVVRKAIPGIPARSLTIKSSMCSRDVSRRIRPSIVSSICWSGMSM